MRVVRAYRFALDPSPAQQAALRSRCGAQRFAFNWGLARVKANLGQREAERSYGVPEALLTPAVSWSAWRLRKDFNAVKHQVAPWWPENSKEAYASGLANLATALANWAASRVGRRRGPKIAFPKFKGKRSARSSSRICMWRECCATGGWPGTSPTPGSARSAASSATRPHGTAGGWWPPTGSTHPRRPARVAAQ